MNATEMLRALVAAQDADGHFIPEAMWAQARATLSAPSVAAPAVLTIPAEGLILKTSDPKSSAPYIAVTALGSYCSHRTEAQAREDLAYRNSRTPR